MRRGLVWFCFVLVFLVSVNSLVESRAQDSASTGDASADRSKLNAGTFSGLRLRAIGPALMSGRISDLAIDPENPNTWYVAVGSGNVWKTVNAGTTWTPIFEKYASYSIGCVTIDPSDRHTIWLGTGEAVGGRHAGFGDGVYVSHDGGQSFSKSGLEKSEHIAKIIVDPRDSHTVYVASQGPMWSKGGERGLYKSTDGGATWNLKLSKGPWTGVTDVVMDPTNSDVLYAATHQRHRTVWALLNGGPETGIHKSTDAGETWVELRSGLPGGDKGKISLEVSPQHSNVVYASIELPGRTGGFWRSEDGGASWRKMSDFVSGGTGPHYYQEIFCDPHRFDVLYQVDVRLARTVDGGANWETVESPYKHVDNHAVAFHPHDPDFLLVGCDGGLYKSYDQGATYAFTANLPLTQFYKLDVDYDTPFYHVVGGTQDNNTQYGPTRTNNVTGIRNSDWRITIGGDGHDCAIDPLDPNIIYCESQQGFLRRYDRRTGEAVDIRPQPGKGQDHLRFNWDAPILISPHSHTRLYFGSRILFRSDDRGDSWTAISPDLSRGLDRYKLKMMDRVWSIDATYDLLAMSQYGNITSVSESPVVEGLIYVGTDDGLIQVTEDGGENWRKIDKIYGVPEFFFVNDIKADLHDPDTVYACVDDHKTGDYQPYLIKSTDRGRTWSMMKGDLPDRHLVWRIIQDHVNPNLFFLGTEFGVFFTLDAGDHWIKLTGGVPTIPFRDLEIQRRENDLVGATFGRGFYVFDDYTPLRTVTNEMLTDNEFVQFPIKNALLHVMDNPLGGSKGYQGDSFFTAPNPPYGAIFTYYMRDSLTTRLQRRQASEAKINAAGGDVPVPSWDDVRAEEREESPTITFTIRDSEGTIVNRVNGPTSAGFHRVAWNLRYASTYSASGFGPLAGPGEYTVSVTKRVDDEITTIGEEVTFQVVGIDEPSLPPQDQAMVKEARAQAGDLMKRLMKARGQLTNAIADLESMRQTVDNFVLAEDSLRTETRRVQLALLDLQMSLVGDETKQDREVLTPPSLLQRAQIALRGSVFSTYGPTKTHREQYAIAAEEFEEWLPRLEAMLAEVSQLQESFESAGVPWLPGRGN